MSWAAFIGAGVGPWVRKGAAALGVGTVVYAGWAAINVQLVDAVSDMYGAMHADIYNVMVLAGLVDAIGIWLAAFAAAVALLAFKRLGVLQG